MKVAKSYYLAVETLLQPLADSEGWKLCKDKNTCCRLILKGNAHMDVPLYIVPDRMFDSLVERNNMILDEAKATIAKDEYVFKGYHTTQLKALKVKRKSFELHYITKIHMALRDGNWKDSDCELICKMVCRFFG